MADDAARARDLLVRARNLTERNERRQFLVAALIASLCVVAMGVAVDTVEALQQLDGPFFGLAVIVPLFVLSWRATSVRPRIRRDRLLASFGLALVIVLGCFYGMLGLDWALAKAMHQGRHTVTFAVGDAALLVLWYRLDRWRSGRRR